MNDRARRSLRAAVLALATIGSVASAAAFGDDAKPTPPPRRAWKLTYKTRLPAPPARTKCLEAWIPTPFVDDLQVVRELVVTASVPYECTKDPVYGNRFLHVAIENPTGETTVDWTAVVERTEDHGQGTGPMLDAYLRSDALASVEGPAKTLAETLGTTNTKGAVRARARIIYDHVFGTMIYDKVEPGWGHGDFTRACEVGKGNCSDFTSKFIAVARASGIPSRWISSISLAGEHMDCSACGYHCYAQFLDDGRWIPVDPSDARRVAEKDPRKADWLFGHDESNNIVLSLGRDIVLAPKQQAGPLNFVAGPYAEADGKPFEIPSKNRTYGHEPVADAKPAAVSAAPAPAK